MLRPWAEVMTYRSVPYPVNLCCNIQSHGLAGCLRDLLMLYNTSYESISPSLFLFVLSTKLTYLAPCHYERVLSFIVDIRLRPVFDFTIHSLNVL